MKTLSLILVTAVIAGVGGFFGQRMISGSVTTPESTKKKAEPAAARQTVTSLGRLEPESELIEVSAPPGSRVDHFAEDVVQGAFVSKGDPLAYLDSHEEMKAAHEHAKAMLAEAQNRLVAETTCGDSAIAEAKLRKQLYEEVAKLGIEAQDAEVRRCTAELAKIRIDFTRSDKMFNDKAIPKNMHDTAQLAVIQMEEQLARNKALLAQMTQDRLVKIEQSKAELESATAGKKKAELSTMTDSLAAAVKLSAARLERTVIRAPVDGEVIKISTRAGESIGSKPILMLGNTRQMVAVAEVYETDARYIKVGQKATVTSKAFPASTTLTGKVERINKLVRKNDMFRVDPTADADSRIVEVRIRLDDSALAGAFSNLQVDVQISVSGE